MACESPRAGAITLFAREAVDRSGLHSEHSLIDVLGAIGLLWWAAEETGETDYRRLAARQARMAADRQLRRDGLVWQQLDFDRRSGDWIACGTRHGAQVAGCWARAQAWAVLGFLTAAAALDDRSLLQAACRALDAFIAAMPETGMPPWDLATEALEPPVADASALAIVASALAKAETWDLELGGREGFLDRGLDAFEAALLSAGEDGLLGGGSAYPLRGEGLHGATVWGDFYLLEALVHLSGDLPGLSGFPLRPPGSS